MSPAALGRRAALGLLTSVCVGTASGHSPDAVPDAATMLIAGPEHGYLDHWGTLICNALSRALAPPGGLRLDRAGGLDGVTGANRFAADAAPDGQAVLLVPGAAMLAWIAGDPRVQFDTARWLPVMAGTTPALLAGRFALDALRPGSTVRFAASDPATADLAGLLALDLLGVQTLPVFGFPDWQAKLDAFARHDVDVLLLHGAGVPDQAAALAEAGGSPMLALGPGADDPADARDRRFPELPTVPEAWAARRTSRSDDPLFDAWRSAAAAAQLEFALVLPALTPAAMVAMWRHAATQALGALRVAGHDDAIVPLAGAAAAAAVGPVALEAPALLEIRSWLSTRLNWQPT